MLDSERPAEPEPTETFDTVLAAVDEIEVEPDAPTDEAETPAGDTPGGTPSEVPAPEETATPEGTDAGESPAGETPTAETPAAPTSETPTEQTPYVLEVDGGRVTLKGSREDGDNVIVPKATLQQEVKGLVRTQLGRVQAQFRQELQKVQEGRSASEHTAETLLKQLDKIMELPEDKALEEFFDLKAGYQDRKGKAEAEYWKRMAQGHTQTADQELHQREMAEYAPILEQQLKRVRDEAVADAVQAGVLPKDLSEAELQAFSEEFYQYLLEEDAAGRIFIPTGKKLVDRFGKETTLPELEMNFPRIAAVRDREAARVRKTRELVAARETELKTLRAQVAKIEAAAKKNAEAEARRKGGSAPPPVRGRPSSEGTTQANEPKSWADIEAEVDKL